MDKNEKDAMIYNIKKKILIVEDNEINREILEALLEDEYEILTAENGLVGYEILSKDYESISLVLLDVYMPVMDGFEFLKKTRSDELLSNIPVIVATGSDKPEDEVKCLKLGASDFVTKPYNPEVVIARVHSIIKLRESVSALSIVEYDELTGLYTLPAFTHRVSEIIKSNPDKSFDMCVANIKDFKLLNSVFGKQKCNETLKYIAQTYRRQLPMTILARQGDKFFSFYEMSSRFDCENGAKYYDELIDNSPIGGLSIKYGIYADVDKNLPVTFMCDRCLIAAHSIKDNFYKAMEFYDSKFEDKMIENQKLEQNFERAIQNDEFSAFYQPKYDSNTEKIVAAEALVRWILPDSKMISPGAFVPLFEKDGLISRLDEYIFKKVCLFQKRRIESGKRAVPISVNLSRNSIYTKGTADRYRKIVDDLNIPIELVPIEITESAMIEGNGILDLANQLISKGFSIHMDDFGTGYSSLSSLSKMPFDVIKLDKSLIDQIGSDKGETIIKHMIMVAQEMGMKIVAEGVEEKKQAVFLRDVGCEMIQGYYYSAPKNETVFASMLDDENNENEKINLSTEYQKIEHQIEADYEIDENALITIEKLADEMMEGFVIYKASSDETIIYANRKLVEMFGCKSIEEFRIYTHNSFRGIVDEDDYEDVEKSIFKQINSGNKNDDAVEYHIKRKDGTKLFVLDQGHCVYTKSYGNIFYVFIKER